jgi:hypothetical protein
LTYPWKLSFFRYCRKRKQRRGAGSDVETKQQDETNEAALEDVNIETSSIENLSTASSYIIIDIKDIDVSSIES